MIGSCVVATGMVRYVFDMKKCEQVFSKNLTLLCSVSTIFHWKTLRNILMMKPKGRINPRMRQHRSTQRRLPEGILPFISELRQSSKILQ